MLLADVERWLANVQGESGRYVLLNSSFERARRRFVLVHQPASRVPLLYRGRRYEEARKMSEIAELLAYHRLESLEADELREGFVHGDVSYRLVEDRLRLTLCSRKRSRLAIDYSEPKRIP